MFIDFYKEMKGYRVRETEEKSERERETEKQRNTDQLVPLCAPTRIKPAT